MKSAMIPITMRSWRTTMMMVTRRAAFTRLRTPEGTSSPPVAQEYACTQVANSAMMSAEPMRTRKVDTRITPVITP